MKKVDIIVILIVCIVLAPFFIFKSFFEVYECFNVAHPYIMAAVKFGILATFGEMLANRIKNGQYLQRTFGLVPKMVVWALLGVWIAFAMKVFAVGVPIVVEKAGITGLSEAMKATLSWEKVLGAFCISTMMNTAFAPVFMTFHKITDIHIAHYQGSIKSLLNPIHFSEIFPALNWKVQWNFVFKKSIPFFWIPAHTITFILPDTFQVLFAAFLSVILGLILAAASLKK
ncbi:MAG: hypothetical protein LBR36_07860 [Bacteroidales bacterium]|jgi:hypothetical protein|nr:hypothetical protein [Bacteroidales bacterium]